MVATGGDCDCSGDWRGHTLVLCLHWPLIQEGFYLSCSYVPLSKYLVQASCRPPAMCPQPPGSWEGGNRPPPVTAAMEQGAQGWVLLSLLHHSSKRLWYLNKITVSFPEGAERRKPTNVTSTGSNSCLLLPMFAGTQARQCHQ